MDQTLPETRRLLLTVGFRETLFIRHTGESRCPVPLFSGFRLAPEWQIGLG
jgi:hypothetical protein